MQSPQIRMNETDQLRVIVIGATSGIGLALAYHYLKVGHLVGLTGRRENILQAVQTEYLGTAYIQKMDVTKAVIAASQLENLIDKMKGVDIIIVNAGAGFINPELVWEKQAETIDVNVTGFTAICTTAIKYFLTKEKGHLVSISSISGLRGNDLAPCYAASKAYVSNYMAGLRKKTIKAKISINITDVLPGFVDTAMGQSKDRFWVSSPNKAAKQIIRAIHKKRKTVYVTKRWRIIVWLMKILPNWVYNKI